MERNTRIERKREENERKFCKRHELGLAYLAVVVEVGTFLLALYAAFN